MLLVLLLMIGYSICTPLHAQEDLDGSAASESDQPTSLSLDELPSPPNELSEMIEAGRVTFIVGGQRPSETKGDSSGTTTTKRFDSGFGRRGRWGRRLSFDAETNFEVHLDYRSRARWRIRWQNEQRHLIVSIRFSNVEVEPTHNIWFKNPIHADKFWDSALVRHEFDHVKLSLLVANQKRFADDLRDHATIDMVIDGDADVNKAMVMPMVDKLVQERFAELLDLIEIRYQELDRQTRHGTRPLDEESELFPLLRDALDVPQDESPLGGDETKDANVRAGELN